jgi:nucleotide-binding universal stress UspA family protein
MEDFRHVLFPVDFSPRCEAAVPYVKEMVRSCHARLTLLHVVEIPLYWYGSPLPDRSIVWDSLEKIFRTREQDLAKFSCEHFSDLAKVTDVKSTYDQGDPGYAIQAQAEHIGADLIMMPTHGHSPYRSFLIGSATARVLHRTDCPVWTGAHIESEPAGAHARIKSIVCAIDLERESRRVIESAVMLARAFSAQVHLAHCVPVPEGKPADDFASEFDRFLAGEARDKLAGLQAEAGTDFKVRLEGGSISKVVRDAANHSSADIVVIGRGHVRAPFSRLRTNAYAIIRDSPCPVLSV